MRADTSHRPGFSLENSREHIRSHRLTFAHSRQLTAWDGALWCQRASGRALCARRTVDRAGRATSSTTAYGTRQPQLPSLWQSRLEGCRMRTSIFSFVCSRLFNQFHRFGHQFYLLLHYDCMMIPAAAATLGATPQCKGASEHRSLPHLIICPNPPTHEGHSTMRHFNLP